MRWAATTVRVENFGTITGNALLGAMNSAYFFNNPGALFNAGEHVFVSDFDNQRSLRQRRHDRTGRSRYRPDDNAQRQLLAERQRHVRRRPRSRLEPDHND